MLSHRQGERIVGVCLALIGGAAGYGAARMDFGTMALPGPGAVPFAVALALLAVGLWLCSPRVRPNPAREGDEDPVELGHKSIGITFLAIVGAGLLLERAGFVPTAFLFLFILLMTYSRVGWLRAAIASLIAAAACYVLFRVLLAVPLPLGPFR